MPTIVNLKKNTSCQDIAKTTIHQSIEIANKDKKDILVTTLILRRHC